MIGGVRNFVARTDLTCFFSWLNVERFSLRVSFSSYPDGTTWSDRIVFHVFFSGLFDQAFPRSRFPNGWRHSSR